MTIHLKEIRPALVLNADYRPLSYAPLSLWCWQDAVKAVFQDRVDVVESYDEMIRSPSFEMPLPAVIVLRAFHKTPHWAALTRNNVKLRDRHRCVYCGSKSELTFDHVVPQSQQGHTEWTNVVIACAPCNNRKSDKTPEEVGMRLPYKPYHPTTHQLMEIGREFPPSSIIPPEFASFVYWNVTLRE